MAPRQGQVLVKVGANALNRVDLAMASGAMRGARGWVGTVLGSEWSSVFAFADVDRALGRIRRNQHFGKIVLKH